MNSVNATRMVPKLALTTCFTILLAGCGEKSGSTEGKDPRIPISLGQPQNPTPPVSDSPKTGDEQGQPNTPSNSAGTSSTPTTGDEPKTGTPAQPEPPAPPRRATLTVSINDLHNTEGNFCLSIFNSPDGFPDSAEKAILAECFAVVSKSFSIQIQNFPPGRYAIAGWHDENRDKKLNYNLFGIPKEGLAFSENGKPRLTPPPGPPSFDSIAFSVGTEDKTTQMKTSYLLDLL